MPKLLIKSDAPTRHLDLTYDGKRCHVVRNGKQWKMTNGDDGPTRLGAASLHWTSALRRAVEAIEGNGK